MIFLAVMMAASLDSKTAVTHLVEVDGIKYHVVVKGRVVESIDKRILARRNPDAGIKLREAVVAATGCRITQEYWEAVHLVGLLDCDSKTP